MPRAKINTTLDLSDRTSKRKLLTEIGALQGLYEVAVCPRRVTRSNAQNSYLWGVVYEAIRLGISEAWGEDLSADEVHIAMRERFLSRPIVNRNTGEVVQNIAGSTAALNTTEFADYLDKIIKFGGEFLNVEVPPADLNCNREMPMVTDTNEVF